MSRVRSFYKVHFLGYARPAYILINLIIITIACRLTIYLWFLVRRQKKAQLRVLINLDGTVRCVVRVHAFYLSFTVHGCCETDLDRTFFYINHAHLYLVHCCYLVSANCLSLLLFMRRLKHLGVLCCWRRRRDEF